MKSLNSLRWFFAYFLMRRLTQRLTFFLSMRTRIATVKSINQILYAPWVNARRRYYSNRFFGTDTPFEVQNGYFKDHTGQFPFALEAVDDCKVILEKFVSARSKKKYLLDYDISRNLSNFSGVIRFCTSDALVGLAARYLGEYPLISGIQLLHSPESDNEKELLGSQKFHLDNIDTKQLKVFLNVSDVDFNNGPTSFLPTDKSREVIELLEYGSEVGVERLEDSAVFKLVDEDAVITNIGSSGSLTAIDTCNCLHYGARHRLVSRTLLMVQFTSVARADARPFQDFSVFESQLSLPQRMLFDPKIVV